MQYSGGKFIVKAGAHVLNVPEDRWVPEARRNADIQNGILMQDVPCASPSTAAYVVFGHSANGWREWHTKNGKKLEKFALSSDAAHWRGSHPHAAHHRRYSLWH